MWLLCTVASALLLGGYEVFKKMAVRNNSVLTVLFLTSVCCTLAFLPAFVLSRCCPDMMSGNLLYVGQLSGVEHLYVLLKSCIVLLSWTLAYYAIKGLPITIAAPIKATQPMFVLIGAFIVFGERMNAWQWTGAIVALTCLVFYSRVGEKEGISFAHNKWIWCLIAAILTGAISGLYDKYMMRRFDRMAVQFWYTAYQILLMIPVMLLYISHQKRLMKRQTAGASSHSEMSAASSAASAASASAPAASLSTDGIACLGGFKWRWSIVLLSLFLCASDFLYFYALSIPDSLISVVSPIRRSGVIVPFLAGAFFLKEKNIKEKALLLLGVLLGILCLYFGSM